VWTFASAEWVVAATASDAAAVLLQETGVAMPSADCEGEWTQLPDDKLLPLHDEDAEPEHVEKTCAMWAAGGRRYLGGAH
jgi:hypothetical protein